MELKAWEYDEMPAFDEEVPGATWLDTTGDEMGVSYLPNVEYQNVGGVPRVLQILVPTSRHYKAPKPGRGASRSYPCIVYVQGSAWMTQDVYGNLPCIARLAARGYVVAIVQYRESGIDLNKNRVARETLTVKCNIDETTDIAPVLIMHGTKDRVVNTKCSVYLHQRLQETGHESHLYLLRGADHGGSEFWADEVLDIVDAFVQEKLG